MKKKTRRLLLLTAVPLAMVLTVAAAAAMLRPPAETADSGPDAKYYLRRYDGMVAVYLPGSTAPEHVTDAPVSCLPASDRAALEKGLPVYSEEELARLLEDYCS